VAEIVSRVHAKNLVEWAADKPEALVLSADLASSTEIDLFRDMYPERFISCGIAEQNMLSVAGGLAREGFVPLVHTFAVFIYRRAYDQVAMSVAYPNMNVKMFGFLPGITTPGGATHQAIEDISLMRSLPNMTVLECGDATDVESVLDVAHSVNGPVYVRMLRGEIPRLFPKEEKMKLDTPRILRKGNDILMITSGICTGEAMKACAFLSHNGVSVGHVHVSTLKPFANRQMIEMLGQPSLGIITVENHTRNGGLGTIIAETLVANGISRKLAKLGLDDTFSHGASAPYLMAEHGIDAYGIIKGSESILDRRFDITRKDLEQGISIPSSALSKPEDL
jgi:transketolase